MITLDMDSSKMYSYKCGIIVCQIGIASSSSSCRTTSTGLPDPLSPPTLIIHHSRSVFKAPSCIGTELLYISSSWSSCLCLSMWRGPQESVAYEFIPTCSVLPKFILSWVKSIGWFMNLYVFKILAVFFIYNCNPGKWHIIREVRFIIIMTCS